MNEFIVLFRKELLEQWRTKKILILAIVFLFVAISSPVLAKLTPELLKTIKVPGMAITLPEPTYKDALDQFIKNISQIALLVLVFVVAGAVSDEKNKKTLEILLSKPVSRSRFVLSKFGSYFFSISAAFTASCIVFYFYTSTTFQFFSFTGFTLMALIVLLYILMIVAITIFASSIVNSSILAGAIGFVSFVVFGMLFGLVEGTKKYSPNLIFSNYKEVVSNGWTNKLIPPMLVILIVIFLLVITAIYFFKGQEIER